MAFWKRKKRDDRFVTLGLNRPSAADATASPDEPQPASQPIEPRGESSDQSVSPSPASSSDSRNSAMSTTSQKSSAWQTSVLGLDLSLEDLQAREAALEQEFSARFRRAVAATRVSLSERIDAVFAGAKQIDAALLDELEEALIAADIGVPTTMHVLETVRRGISRKEIDDIEKLKHAIKSELLSILQASEKQGVASESSVPENI